MRFAHLADLHLGSWRDPDLRQLGLKALEMAIDEILSLNVDFVIIAGDLFHTALPSIDIVKGTVRQLKRLKDKGIPIFVVPGSHDFSPSGKTMLEVLEELELITIVSKTLPSNEGLRLKEFRFKNISFYGIPGRMLGLDKNYFDDLLPINLDRDRFNIFVFHSGLKEFLPKNLSNVEAVSINSLPTNFDYYATGHIHLPRVIYRDGKLIVFPGPLMPDNFQELEELGMGSYFIVYVDEDIELTPKMQEFSVNNKKIIVEKRNVMVKNVLSIDIDCSGLTISDINDKLFQSIENKELFDSIVLVRLHGMVKSGRISELRFKEFVKKCMEGQAFKVLRNTSKLEYEEYKEVRVEKKPLKEMEDELIKANIGKNKELFSEEKEELLIKALLNSLGREKNEDETKSDYEERVLSEAELLIKNLVKDLIGSQ